MAKSYGIALILWATLGILGAHHFYLRRDRHGVVHLLTFGGFLLGWLYDLRNLDNYVRWANFDREFKEKYLEKIEMNKEPEDPLLKNLSGTALCQTASALLIMAVPPNLASNETFSYYVMPILTAMLVAFIVYYLGNIGETQGTYKSALKGALISVPYYYYSPTGSVIWCVFASKNTFEKKYRPRPEDNGNFWRRLYRSLLVTGLIGGLCVCYFIYNCEVGTDDGESVSCVDSLHFLNASMWSNFKETMIDLYNYMKYNGLGSLWNDIVKAVDMTGTDNAIKLLGLTKPASESDIKASYKKLARQYHPDKVKDPTKRSVAQEKFMEIQNAYELLSKTKAKRGKHNGKSRMDDKIEL